jgi:hypothetical protein
MEQFTREQWLALPSADIAVQVWDRKIGVLLTSDGTRRHYLLQHPEEKGRITNYEAYMQHTAQLYLGAFEVLYRLGIYAILTPSLYSLNFLRGGKMLEFFLDSTRRALLYPPYTDFYARWQTRTRLYGDYDIAPAAEPVREGLQTVQDELNQMTPQGERLLLFGYTGGTFHEEQIARTAALQAALNRPPTVAELRRACFPDGPDQVDIHIGGGWMRTGRVLRDGFILQRRVAARHHRTHDARYPLRSPVSAECRAGRQRRLYNRKPGIVA